MYRLTFFLASGHLQYTDTLAMCESAAGCLSQFLGPVVKFYVIEQVQQ